MIPTNAILGGLNRLAQNIIGKHDVILNLLARVFSSSFVHTVPSLVFLFTVGVFLYDHNPQINFLKRKWMKNLAKGVICWFFVHVSLQVWLLFQQMVYILVRNYWQLPSHYVETSAILWDFLWGVKHQPAEPRIPVDFVYLCVTGACAVALLASVGRPRVVVKLLTTSATLGVENMLRVANNYLHRMKALLPQRVEEPLQAPAPSCRRRRSEWMTQRAECEDDGAEEEMPPPSDEPLTDHSKKVTRRNRTTSLSQTNIEARDISAE